VGTKSVERGGVMIDRYYVCGDKRTLSMHVKAKKVVVKWIS